jgi:predicted lysophospholipase L1 biosynthesis ABC-type transport system permease subunit
MRQLLGGDAVLASDNPAPPAFAERARALGLQVGATQLSDHGSGGRRAGRCEPSGGPEGGR